ncbi:putative small integral membrane protein [Palleronia aestuarii]|uniref:Putative small integral membrane protein n=1 Tax=Palleronia aestuarii TaxID=568105 RepID=A0A2W7NUC3_9RHOB|nr:DUF2160 domain-containing protein [Palleronia aestuarii]PZX16936.1 putative small integral membrane protein [Palleronia aestuarii]
MTHTETDDRGVSHGHTALFATLVTVWIAIGLFIFWTAMRASGEESAIAWTESLNPGGWMAWVLPTALFFWLVAGTLVVFTILAIRYPETPKQGVLGIETTRGDRLFISLLAAGFINLAWLGFALGPQYLALIVSVIVAAAIFRLA